MITDLHQAAASAATVEVLAQSPGVAPAAVICVPTYRRPELLRQTLESLFAQDAAFTYAIVVVENDGVGREGAKLAAAMLAEGRFTGAVLCESRQGNCKVYNAAWRHVRQTWPETRWICGIDDDEEATPGWLGALVTAARESGAGIIGGPVRPLFSDARFERLRLHPVFSSHYRNDGPVPQIYSSANYLIRADVLDRMGFPYLDERFDYTGGGDSDFFARARAEGVRFWWATRALMTETIPARRTELSWINARSVRNGMLSALIERKNDRSRSGHVRRIGKSLALLLASPLRGVIALARSGSPLIAIYHAQVAIGRIGAEFGLNIEQYRQPEKN